VGLVLALGSALSFGISDFTGALAARRASAITITITAQLAGLVLLVPVLALLPARPSPAALLLGAVAGLVGSGGLVLYLRCMAIGPMGVVSPLAAVVGAAVPVGWGVALAGERLAVSDVFGVVAGLAAVVMVAYVPGSSPFAAGTRGPVFAAAAGVSFGLFFVTLDATPADSGLWPLLGARFGGMALLLTLLVFARRRFPTGGALGLAFTSGLLDMLANVLFLLATRSGLLSLVSLLTSLYPVVVLLLARQVLRERLTRLQAVGVGLALVATALIVT
jgi:drug/metabolite transporter (DMT)-like permease